MSQHIAIALSGGVDSALSAWLLREQGYRVSAIFMRNWEDKKDEHCQADLDCSDAQMVCDHLGIPLHQVNFSKDYWDRVFSHCLDEFAAGRTPNPDIWCNREIKFDCLLKHALNDIGADALATGHYAQIKTVNQQSQLHQGLDQNKDQSYFLYALSQQQLEHVIFPLGGMQKTNVRKMAKQAGLINHAKKDSTGICFIGEKRFKQFLSDFLICKPGKIETDDGEVIGRHDGVMFYTIGQRQGLNIGGLSNHSEQAWYVIDKDISRNVLIVGQGNQHPRLFKQTLQAENIHWIAGSAPIFPLHCSAKTRYRQSQQSCLCDAHGDGITVHFEQPQRAITPGQSIVFYQAEHCLGGGIITAEQNQSG